MTGLAVSLVLAGGRGRLVLLGASTAVVCALLLVALTLLSLPETPREQLFALVAEPGTRGGTTLAALLLTLPPLLLLHQTVRLGTAARHRRLAALRLAGATPAEVRWVGALEVGVPALLGSLVGVLLYGLLRVVAGGAPATGEARVMITADPRALRLVPTSVGPEPWQVAAVVALSTAAGVAVGAWATRAVVVSPLGVTRRQRSAPPRPWGLVLLGGCAVAAPLALDGTFGTSDTPGAVIAGVAVLGVVSLGPWAAYRCGLAVAARASSGPSLLAARRLVVDPRPIGRAAAAIGAVGLVGGAAAGFGGDLLGGDGSSSDPYYAISLGLVVAALTLALLVALATLAVHSAENLLDRRRSVASLAALGVTLSELDDARRWEGRLVALPMIASGFGLGVLAYWGIDPEGLLNDPTVALTIAACGVLLVAAAWLAVSAAVLATRPWARRAAAPENLRTP